MVARLTGSDGKRRIAFLGGGGVPPYAQSGARAVGTGIFRFPDDMILLSPAWIAALFCGALLLGSELRAQTATGPSPQSLHLELRLQIGEEMGPPEYLLTRVTDIALTSDATIYLLDGAEHVVKVYDGGGRFLRRFAREGSGPGEFLGASAIAVDSVVRVLDLRQSRISTFTRGGEHLSTDQVPRLSEPGPSGIFPLRGGGTLGLTTAVVSPGSEAHRPNQSVVYLPAGGGTLRTLASYRADGVIWHPRGGRNPWGVFAGGFGNAGALAVQGDSLFAIVNGYDGIVQWYDATGTDPVLTREGRVPLRSPPVTEADLAAAERRIRESSRTLPADLVVEAPQRWSVGSGALFAADGSLWIRSSVDADAGQVWSILPPHSGEPRVIRMMPGFELIAVEDTKLYGVVRTANDVPLLRVYEWRWQ